MSKTLANGPTPPLEAAASGADQDVASTEPQTRIAETRTAITQVSAAEESKRAKIYDRDLSPHPTAAEAGMQNG